MSMTLVEANKYSNDTLQQAVIDILVKDSQVLSRMKFRELVGNSLTYNRVTTRATASFYDVGDTWQEDTHVMTQQTAQLRILGGDADIDEFLKRTRSNIIDIEQEVLEQKSLAVKETFTDNFYYGSNSGNAKEFDGLHTLIASTTYNTVHAGASTGTALSIDKLRQAIDLIKGVKPDLILSSKAMRRRISTYLDSIGASFPGERDQFGSVVHMFEDIPWAVDDWIVDTETASSGAYSAQTGGANTSIFIVSFGNDGIQGLQAGPLSVKPVGELETKDATRYRIKWYVSTMLQSLISCAKVDGIVAASAVTA